MTTSPSKQASTAGAVFLTPPQVQVLIVAARFVLAGEWDETINGTEKNTLDRAVKKLHAAIAKAGDAS